MSQRYLWCVYPFHITARDIISSLAVIQHDSAFLLWVVIIVLDFTQFPRCSITIMVYITTRNLVSLPGACHWAHRFPFVVWHIQSLIHWDRRWCQTTFPLNITANSMTGFFGELHIYVVRFVVLLCKVRRLWYISNGLYWLHARSCYTAPTP